MSTTTWPFSTRDGARWTKARGSAGPLRHWRQSLKARLGSSRRRGLACLLILAALEPARAIPSSVRPAVTFTEIAEAAGIRFRHVAGRTPEQYMIEAMGSGVCFLDFDCDGNPDLYFVRSCLDRWASGSRPGHYLFRND